jgi:endonuclease/exonuclease/phosphatase family metal-dependent hydrolase
MMRTVLPLALVGVLIGAPAAADTYVYITNSTPNPVQIEVAHTGSGGTLVQGKEWQQEATEIAPYATTRVLAFNRYWGVKNGKTYYFDTKIKVGGEVITAKQSLTGTWSSSTVVHSAQGADFIAPWANDRAIHRYSTRYQLRDSTLAFKAKFTGGYDDFYYTISNNAQIEALAAADTLKVLTYNTFALPVVAADISARLSEMPKHLKGYDAILLQELFSGDGPALLRALSGEYPYQTEIVKNKNSINMYNGGVAIVSRYPIAHADYVVYPNCTGTDCFADKGFVHAEVIKAGKAYHLVGTHTASFDTDAARQLRQAQFQQMRTHIENEGVPSFDAVVYGGDFNVNKLKFPEDYQAMQVNLNGTVPVSTGYTESTFDPRVNTYAAAYDTVEYLDYLVWSHAHRAPVESRNDVRVPRTTSDSLWEKWDLSDHFPVLGEFAFQ